MIGFIIHQVIEILKREDYMRDLDEFCTRLDEIFDGITHFSSTFPSQCKIDNGWCDYNQYCLRFNPNMKGLLRGKLLVGSWNRLTPILAVMLSFHDQDGNTIQDDFGRLLRYTSIPQDLGHLLEISRSRFDYSYAKFIFKLLSDENFDPNSIFFHFARSLLSTSTSTTTITATTALSKHQ
jgi:hypothetical protein